MILFVFLDRVSDSYTSRNIIGVQWTKLLMNEINASKV